MCWVPLVPHNDRGQFLKHERVGVVLGRRQKCMSSCGAGGQFVISVHYLLKSQGVGRDSLSS